MRSGTDVLTLTDVARRYDVAYITAYQWARTGKIPAFQMSNRGRWRVYRADLDDMEQRSGRVGGSAA